MNETRKQRLERFVSLAMKSGRIWVASDIYDELLPILKDGLLPESGVLVERCDYLSAGEMVACDFSLINTLKTRNILC